MNVQRWLFDACQDHAQDYTAESKSVRGDCAEEFLLGLIIGITMALRSTFDNGGTDHKLSSQHTIDFKNTILLDFKLRTQ